MTKKREPSEQAKRALRNALNAEADYWRRKEAARTDDVAGPAMPVARPEPLRVPVHEVSAHRLYAATEQTPAEREEAEWALRRAMPGAVVTSSAERPVPARDGRGHFPGCALYGCVETDCAFDSQAMAHDYAARKTRAAWNAELDASTRRERPLLVQMPRRTLIERVRDALRRLVAGWRGKR